MFDWFHQLYDPEGLKQLIVAGGYLLLMGIVFAETGLLIGFFLPGDSLLFLAGTLCSVNILQRGAPPPLEATWVIAGLTLAAVLGNTVNFWLGKWTGDRMWNRPDGRLIKRRHLEQARAFYERYGAVSLVLTRFVPVARTFVPFVAGASRMGFLRYTVWNLVGAACWVPSLVAAGYWLGQREVVQRHLELIILAIIAISVAPMAIAGFLRWRRSRASTPPEA